MSKQAFREMILGGIKAKDTQNQGLIHASDFHNSVENLGLETGSELIEEIMVQRNIHSDGMIDYSGFEQRVNEERAILNQLKDIKENDSNYQARRAAEHLKNKDLKKLNQVSFI